MKVVFAIAWRDFKSLLQMPMLYLILGLCSVMMSFFYMRNIFMFAARSRMVVPSMGEGPNLQMDIFAQHISLVHLLLLLVTPVLTMRLLSEEKKMRTYDLLLTAPVSALQIAAGKYLAGFYSAMLVIGISFLYPLATGWLTEIAWGPLLSAYLGMILVIAIYVAIGLFASSLSESIVLSVILGWIFSLMVFFIGQASSNSSDPVWSAVFEQISMPEHLYAFLTGSIRTKSMIFLLSVIALFVFLTERVVESSRWR